MLRRGAYLVAGFVSQGVVFAVCLFSRGAGWSVAIAATGVERTAGLHMGTAAAVRSYLRRLQGASRWRTGYRRVTRPLAVRYRQLKTGRRHS